MTNTATATTKFETGKTYATRSNCNWDCIFKYTVVRRTAKCVWLQSYGKEITRRTIRVRDGIELVSPEGSYSMSPVLGADDTLEKVVAQG